MGKNIAFLTASDFQIDLARHSICFENISLTLMCDILVMLQVWKIEIPTLCANNPTTCGWALAHTAEEAKKLSGCENAAIRRMPEHLWIARERVIWESPNSDQT